MLANVVKALVIFAIGGTAIGATSNGAPIEAVPATEPVPSADAMCCVAVPMTALVARRMAESVAQG